MAEVRILKADGGTELFDKKKLEESLKNAGADEALAQEISAHIEEDLASIPDRRLTTGDIYHHAFSFLQKEHHVAAARYSLRRALIGFGPTGFPFEKFVGEIFKAEGYEFVNDQILVGSCVEHEVDVVAWTKGKLTVSEIKFHNELGLKSDLKVALYVKARMDDLKAKTFSYGGQDRHIDEGWLITNTKFSTQAIKYGECAGLRLLGWNYPEKGNLQDKIEEHSLHPVSCLTTLSAGNKQELYAQGVVLCRSLTKDPSILEKFHFPPEKLAEITVEIKELCNC